MAQLAKIRRHYWKERLEISKITKFESDTSLEGEDTAPKSCENLQTFVWWGGGWEQVFTPTIQTCQKLERTMKLDLFFYGHFGKVLSLEWIFFLQI